MVFLLILYVVLFSILYCTAMYNILFTVIELGSDIFFLLYLVISFFEFMDQYHFIHKKTNLLIILYVTETINCKKCSLKIKLKVIDFAYLGFRNLQRHFWRIHGCRIFSV